MSRDEPRHGTLAGYNHDLCRCELCREAHRLYDSAYRGRRRAERRREAAAAAPSADVPAPPKGTWRSQANCVGVPSAVFFPAVGEHEDPRTVRQAVAQALEICSACPAREACLEENLDERYGVWGGTTEKERRQLRRQRRREGAA